MAESVHLFLKANGEDIKGGSTQTSLERADSIECVYFDTTVRTAREKGTGIATGRRTHDPIKIRKRIDKSTPLLYKALCNNEVIEGTFKFYRPNPAGDGTTQQFYTIEVGAGRVASIRAWSPECLDPAASADPPLEEVGFVFGSINWTFEDGGISHEDSWSDSDSDSEDESGT